MLFLAMAALAFGGYFAACEVFGTYEFLLKDQGGLSYIVFAGCGIAAAVSLLPAWAAFAWRGRKILSVVLWGLFFVALLTVVSAALGRTGTYTDIAQEKRQKADDIRTAASGSETEAEQAVTDAKASLKAARDDAIAQAHLRGCATNCAALLQSAITNAANELSTARRRLDAARSQVVAAPPKKTDPLSKRIAAVIPHVTEEQVRLYQPIAVPALTSALSAVLVVFGVWAFGRVLPNFGRSKVKSPQPPASASAKEPLAVHASDQVAPPIATSERAADALPRPAVPLQIVGPGSKLANFAATRIRRDEKAETHMRDARRAYEDFCAEEIETPLALPAFVRELASLCQRTGIGVRVDGKDAFLVGARLVA